MIIILPNHDLIKLWSVISTSLYTVHSRVTERLKRDTIADRSRLLSALLSIRTANKNVDMLNLLSIFVFSNNRKYEF